MTSPNEIYPIPNVTRTVFLKNIITNPQIVVGDYTYYDDPEDVHNFEKNVLYLFDFVGDKLIIGKFCQIATAVKFIMNGANHDVSGISTYPFKAFGWQDAQLHGVNKGDTRIGNDVWIGYGATIMPSVNVGDGAIIGSMSVVTKDVEPYSIVAGSPAKVIRIRYDSDSVDFLVRLKWWDWDIQKLTDNLHLFQNIDELKRKIGNEYQSHVEMS